MRMFYLIVILVLVAIGAWIVGSVAQAIYCYSTAQDFIFHGVNHGNNASDCAAETAAYGFVFLIPSFLFVQLPMLLILRSVFEGMRPTILFILFAVLPYALVVWLLFGLDFLPVLGVSSLMFGLGSQRILSAYDNQTVRVEREDI